MTDWIPVFTASAREPKWGVKIGERRKRKVPVRYHGLRAGPFDARGVPADAGIVVRVVHRAGLVDERGGLAERTETMREPARYIEDIRAIRTLHGC